MTDRKRRHHHVWQLYLKSWTINDKIWCFRDRKIFNPNTVNVAVERDFYKLHILTKADIDLIKFLVIEKSPPYSKASHERFLDLLTLPARFMEENRGQLKNIEKIQAALDVYMCNILEDHHSRIESSFTPLLKNIISEDISFYKNDDDSMKFSYYIATQYMRTKKIKERIIEELKEKSHIDLTRIWVILSEFFSENIAATLFVERKRRSLTLIKNSTGMEFITGDQPVINLEMKYPESASELVLYYPISPRLALVLSEVDRDPPFKHEKFDASQVTKLNSMMFDACYDQVFAASRATIASLRSGG